MVESCNATRRPGNPRVPERVSDPVLHVIAGPNGAGKSTLYDKVLGPVTHLQFVNADVIAAESWPLDPVSHAYEAARIAATERERLIEIRRSFVTETVFSHESKLAMLRGAEAAGYRVILHIVLIPEELAVARVLDRVRNGGHAVPEDKVRSRIARLWTYLGEAIGLVDEARVYDNTSAHHPFELLATYVDGHLTNDPRWPSWSPDALRRAGA